jgi:hypothetical protein
MKRSERLMRNTIVVLGAVSVLYVAGNRLYAIDNPAPARQGTSADDLGALRDFSAISARGDFSVEIVQGAEYSVSLTPADASAGSLYAAVDDNTLVLRGLRSQASNHVRVTLPTLTRLYVDRVPAVSISGFSGDSLVLQLESNPHVTLRSNAIRRWKVSTDGRGDLRVDKASVAAGQFDMAGDITFAVVE